MILIALWIGKQNCSRGAVSVVFD